MIRHAVAALFLFCGISLLSAGGAAADGWKAIGPRDDAVDFRMGWADLERSSHATRWTKDYAIQLFISQWWSRSGGFPWAGILVQRLQPFHYWREPDAIDKRDVELWQSVRQRAPRDFRELGCGALHCTTFAIDGSRCVAFLYPTGPLGTGSTGDDGSDLVSGFYCPGTTAPIDPAAVEAVIDAIKVKRPPPPARAAPPSDT